MRIIIIGSGLGGLSAGAMLSRMGHDVTVLEQAHQIGGCLQCFERDGVRFETGMHVVGSIREGEILSNYLKMFGVDDKLHFSSLDRTAYDIVSLKGHQYRFANGHEEMIDSLLPFFPGEGDNLRNYWRLVDSVARSAPHYGSVEGKTAAANELYQRSLNSVINHVVDDPLLRQVLVGNIPLYAAVKDRTPFSTHAFVADFYNKGAYRFVGGSDMMAVAFRELIEGCGGSVLTCKHVVEMRCKGSMVESAVTSDGECYDGDIFISDIYPGNLLSMFSPEVLRSAYVERVTSFRNTSSVFSLFLRFKEGCVPYLNSNYFCYRGETTPWTLGSSLIDRWPDGYLYMHHCHADHAEYARSGVVLSYMPYEWLKQWYGTRQGRRGADYERFKRQCAVRMLDALDESFPGIKSCVSSYYTATPLSYRDYTLTPEGAMYGVLRDVNLGVAGRISWRTKLPNLMFVGQNINAHGILGVLIGSLQVCEGIVENGERRAENKGRETGSGVKSGRADILIIGGGLGGLFTGALLARDGRKVTVVEKNRHVGGGLQMFRRGDVEYATGMHVFGGFVKGSVMDRVCSYLGLGTQTGVVDTDADCSDEIRLPDGRRIAMPRGRDSYERNLSMLFPHETDGIKSYLDAIYALAREEMSLWDNPRSKPIEDPRYLWPADAFIAHYIQDPDLRGLLSYLAPLYAGVAGETPAFEHAIVNVLHIEGASMFSDGSQHLADALAGIITDAGGEIVTGQEVTEVEVEERRAVAVVTADGRRIETDHVVSDIDPRQLVRIVTRGAFPASFCNRINEASYSYSAFKLFLRMKEGTVLHEAHPHYFYNGDMADGVWNADGVSIERWPLCAMAVTGVGRDGRHAATMTVVAPVSYDWFGRWSESRSGRRPSEYYTFKKELERKLMSLIERAMPELVGNVESSFASTPLTIRDYNGIHRGSMYGFHKDCNHIMYTKLSVNTKVQNLYLTGQSVNLHGMCGVVITSVMTAEALLGRGGLLREM